MGTHTLSLSGGGYTFTGTYSNGVLSGTFTNPTSATGGFTTQSGSAGSLVAYCGTFRGSLGGTAYWNVTINSANNVVTGVGHDTGSNSYVVSIAGTASGSSLSSTFTVSGDGHGTWAATLSGTSVTGTTSNTTDGETGTITGSRCS